MPHGTTAYFSACFKKKYGMTPKAYLDSIRGQVL